MKRKMSTDEMLNRFFRKIPQDKVEEARKESWKKLEAELAKRDTSLRSLYGDGWSVGPLDEREFLVLSATALIGGTRDPGDVARAAQSWAPGLLHAQVYITLMHLEKKGFVTESPGPSEGLRLYEATAEGHRALARAREEGKVLEAAREGRPIQDGLTEKPKP
jgi:hypothetical protein